MTTRVIRESWDGGDITVGASQQPGRVLVSSYERGAERADLLLAAGELDELIAALQAARAEMTPADEPTFAEHKRSCSTCQSLLREPDELLANSTPVGGAR